MSEKKCLYCGAVIYQRNADKFCCHTCRGAYLRQQADLKRFKQIPDFEEKLKQWIKPIKIVVQRCYPYTKTNDDLDDFKQICLISLWKLLSNHSDKLKVGYLMKTFEIAIKEYCREQGKHSQNFIDEDAIFLPNPEGIAEQREIIRKIVNDEKFKLLLAYSLNDKTEKEMAERIGITKSAFSYKIWGTKENFKTMSRKLTKSKERVKKYGEVFTPIWVVNEMLDELEKESDAFSDVGKTFLEPTCGTGNFVVEIYRRKLNRCKNDRAKAEIALRSLWCIELLEDNMQECRQRVKDVFAYYGWKDLPFDEVFEKQFLIGDSLKIMKQWEEEEKNIDTRG